MCFEKCLLVCQRFLDLTDIVVVCETVVETCAKTSHLRLSVPECLSANEERRQCSRASAAQCDLCD
jgi:hypothetical protein